MQSYKRRLTDKIVNINISSINMKTVIYFIENIKVINRINLIQKLPFNIHDYSNAVIKLEFLSIDKEPEEEMLDQINVNNMIGLSIENLLGLLTNEEKKDNILKLEESQLIHNDKQIIDQNWENNRILKSLLIDNKYYFVSYHPLDERIIETMDIMVKEYLKEKNNNSIKFWNFRIGDIGLEYLCMKFNLMNNLLKLNLNGSGINNLGLTYLSISLKYITNLQELWFHCNNITFSGIKSLSNNLHFISNLSKLGMNRNYISDNGLIYLCKYLSDITNLVHLDIGYNCIREEGVNELCNNLHYISKLKRLNLRENKINDKCNDLLINKLILCPELEYLDIEGVEMPNEEIYEKIKKKHPNKELNIVKIKK